MTITFISGIFRKKKKGDFPAFCSLSTNNPIPSLILKIIGEGIFFLISAPIWGSNPARPYPEYAGLI